jgi:ATP-binding cassette subfamily B protein
VRALVRDRAALLRLLGVIGWWRVTGLALIEVAVTLLPAVTAAAVGVLVARVADVAAAGGDAESAAVPLVAVGVLLVLDLVAQSLLSPLRDLVALRVNGKIRRQTRLAVLAFPGVDHLDDQAVRAAAALPVYDQYLFNMGAAAEGQLWLMARFVGAAGSAALIATYSPLLAVFALAALLTQRAMLRRQYARVVAPGTNEVGNAAREAEYWRSLATTPAGGKEIRLFGFGDFVVDAFTAPHAVVAKLRERLYTRALPRQWITFVLSALAVGVPFVVLTRAALAGDLSTARLATTLGAVIALTSIGTMGFEAFSIEAAVPQLAALREVESLSATASTPVTRHAADAGAESDVPTIRFDDVSFRYPGRAIDVFTNLNLEIAPGESIAIVGENGAGKTTLLKLLAAFYAPTSGRVLIDGVDLHTLDPDVWRRRLAVIFQDFVHFELSARDNIALADLDQGDVDHDARAAAEAAGAIDLIDGLPRGWDSMLSRDYEGGSELSGGQWQRIALARALYAARVGARVLVLDEPTANLDVHAETALFDQLLEHARGLTAIVVSHRFSTVRRAQRIVVLGDGAVLEDGSHDDLLARAGVYARLYRLQADKFAMDDTPPVAETDQ